MGFGAVHMGMLFMNKSKQVWYKIKMLSPSTDFLLLWYCYLSFPQVVYKIGLSKFVTVRGVTNKIILIEYVP